MKESLKVGLTHTLTFDVTDAKTVPALYPESEKFQEMPPVLATGFMVGLLEWACLELLVPHLDWPNEQTVGTHVNFSHEAATPPGLTITVQATLTALEGKKASFNVIAHDGVDQISTGTHERYIVNRERFMQGVDKKRR